MTSEKRNKEKPVIRESIAANEGVDELVPPTEIVDPLNTFDFKNRSSIKHMKRMKRRICRTYNLKSNTNLIFKAIINPSTEEHKQAITYDRDVGKCTTASIEFRSWNWTVVQKLQNC